MNYERRQIMLLFSKVIVRNCMWACILEFTNLFLLFWSLSQNLNFQVIIYICIYVNTILKLSQIFIMDSEYERTT